MRWNCPHCGTQLAVADEKVGNGWSFSRCYKCAGYGLVRRSDVTLIKVDRAPEGEVVLLPEAHENATTMLSDAATRNLTRLSANSAARAQNTASNPASNARTNAESRANTNARTNADSRANTRTSADPRTTSTINVTGGMGAAAGAKPVIRTATPRNHANTQNANPAQALQQANARAAQNLDQARTHAMAMTHAAQNFGLPAPLPDEPQASMSQRLAPLAIGMAGLLTIGSGIYLYMQGQALFEKARAQANKETAVQPGPETFSIQREEESDADEGPGPEIVLAPSAPALPSAASIRRLAGAGSASIGTSSTSPSNSATSGNTASNSATSSIHLSNILTDQVHSPAARAISPDATVPARTSKRK